jgi:hypothetical protein
MSAASAPAVRQAAKYICGTRPTAATADEARHPRFHVRSARCARSDDFNPSTTAAHQAVAPVDSQQDLGWQR